MQQNAMPALVALLAVLALTGASSLPSPWHEPETDSVLQREDGVRAYFEIQSEEPMFSLAGTDPERLGERIRELIAAQQAYEDMLPRRDRSLVSRAMLPERFLATLPRLERLRRSFMASPDRTTATAYHRALVSTLRAYLGDADALIRALDRSGQETLAVVGGSVDKESLREAVAVLSTKARTLLATEGSRFACVTGGRCPSISAHSVEPPAAAVEEVPAAVLARKDFYLGTGLYEPLVYADARLVRGSERIIALARPRCAGDSPAYYLSVELTGPGDTRAWKALPLGDLVFLDTHAATGASGFGGYLKELRDRGVRWYFQPVSGYLCPDHGFDAARVASVRYLADLAASDPLGALGEEIASEERRLGIAPVASDGHIESYVQALERYLRDAPSATDMHATEARERILAWRSQTGGFDLAIADTHVLNESLRFFLRFGISAEVLLTTRSYPSLLFMPFSESIGAAHLSFYAKRYPLLTRSGDIIRTFDGDLDANYSLAELLTQVRAQGEISRSIVGTHPDER